MKSSLFSLAAGSVLALALGVTHAQSSGLSDTAPQSKGTAAGAAAGASPLKPVNDTGSASGAVNGATTGNTATPDSPSGSMPDAQAPMAVTRAPRADRN